MALKGTGCAWTFLLAILPRILGSLMQYVLSVLQKITHVQPDFLIFIDASSASSTLWGCKAVAGMFFDLCLYCIHLQKFCSSPGMAKEACLWKSNRESTISRRNVEFMKDQDTYWEDYLKAADIWQRHWKNSDVLTYTEVMLLFSRATGEEGQRRPCMQGQSCCWLGCNVLGICTWLCCISLNHVLSVQSVC